MSVGNKSVGAKLPAELIADRDAFDLACQSALYRTREAQCYLHYVRVTLFHLPNKVVLRFVEDLAESSPLPNGGDYSLIRWGNDKALLKVLKKSRNPRFRKLYSLTLTLPIDTFKEIRLNKNPTRGFDVEILMCSDKQHEVAEKFASSLFDAYGVKRSRHIKIRTTAVEVKTFVPPAYVPQVRRNVRGIRGRSKAPDYIVRKDHFNTDFAYRCNLPLIDDGPMMEFFIKCYRPKKADVLWSHSVELMIDLKPHDIRLYDVVLASASILDRICGGYNIIRDSSFRGIKIDQAWKDRNRQVGSRLRTVALPAWLKQLMVPEARTLNKVESFIPAAKDLPSGFVATVVDNQTDLAAGFCASLAAAYAKNGIPVVWVHDPIERTPVALRNLENLLIWRWKGQTDHDMANYKVIKEFASNSDSLIIFAGDVFDLSVGRGVKNPRVYDVIRGLRSHATTEALTVILRQELRTEDGFSESALIWSDVVIKLDGSFLIDDLPSNYRRLYVTGDYLTNDVTSECPRIVREIGGFVKEHHLVGLDFFCLDCYQKPCGCDLPGIDDDGDLTGYHPGIAKRNARRRGK